MARVKLIYCPCSEAFAGPLQHHTQTLQLEDAHSGSENQYRFYLPPDGFDGYRSDHTVRV